MIEKTLRALRGAVCASNDGADIAAGAAELYDELFRRNGLAEGDILSLEFSVTQDLNALNPASALRRSGRAGEAAMMVFQEAVFRDTLPGTIRVLVLCYMDKKRPPEHVYFRGAEILRPDRTGKP
ncbi:MAG: chorismate mutase [Treponema sp.]|nr:chorismate mutase [Treponema sp.]